MIILIAIVFSLILLLLLKLSAGLDAGNAFQSVCS